MEAKILRMLSAYSKSDGGPRGILQFPGATMQLRRSRRAVIVIPYAHMFRNHVTQYNAYQNSKREAAAAAKASAMKCIFDDTETYRKWSLMKLPKICLTTSTTLLLQNPIHHFQCSIR